MKKNITGLMVLLLLTGCAESSYVPEVSIYSQQATTLDTTVSSEITIETTYDPQVVVIPHGQTGSEVAKDDVILSLGRKLPERAVIINSKTMESKETLVDVLTMEWSSESIRQLIDKYVIPDKPYIDGYEITEADKQELLDSRDIDGVTGAISYGLIKENTAMRSFPSDRVLTGDLNEKTADFLQETCVYGGSPVAVLHTSEDGLWVFVQSENYAGWVKRSAVVVADRSIIQAYLDTTDYVVITKPVIKIGTDVFRMGQVLPRVDGRMLVPEQIDKADMALCLAGDELVLDDTPAENADKLYVRYVDIPAGASESYLSGSSEDIELLAESLIGIEYAWGDKGLEGFDCSSTVGSIYRCFGIVLPRNTSQLKATGAEVISLSELSSEERQECILEAPAGSLLVLPGHVLMLVDHPERQFFHNSTHYYNADGEEIKKYSAGFSPMDIKGGSGKLYTELATFLINLS